MIGENEIREAMQAELDEEDNLAWLQNNGLDPEAVLTHAEGLAESLITMVATIYLGGKELDDDQTPAEAGFSLVASALMAQFALGYRLGMYKPESDFFTELQNRL